MTDAFDPDLLEQLWRGDWRASSRFAVALPASSPPPDAYALIERAALVDFALEQVDAARGEIFALRGPGVRIALEETAFDSTRHEMLDPDFGSALLETLAASDFAITLETVLLEPVLNEYHGALRLLDMLAPDAVALADMERLRWLSGTWLRSAAASHAPPPPASLYSVHVVAEGDRTWIHTHGLVRCGSIEIEVMDIPLDHVDAVNLLVQAAASRFIEHGPPPIGETFEVGSGLELAWIPWDDASQRRRTNELGGRDDREGHSGLVGALVVPTGKKRGLLRRGPVWGSVMELVPIIDDEPLFYVSTMETNRMAMLASDRFADFRRLLRRADAEDDWCFLVKLAYQVDGDELDPDRSSEHLWFEVHRFVGAEMDATLMNDPFQIARMNIGDRGLHAADQLSDWSIHTPEGVFGPDQVDTLLE